MDDLAYTEIIGVVSLVNGDPASLAENASFTKYTDS